MSTALLVHFLGFYAINSMMPGWVKSADADILSIWYGCFALVDLIALMSIDSSEKGLWSQVNRYGLGTSMAWSTALMVEMLMLNNTLQPSDGEIQRYLDIILGLSLVCGTIQLGARKAKA